MQRLLQFTLDLFDRRADPAPIEAPHSPKVMSNLVLATELMDSCAIDVVAKSVASPGPTELTLAQALAPVTFRHPQATRETLLAGVLVAYAFRRGKRRTIGFSVGVDGLVVSAPAWVPLHEIDKAVASKADWIVQKLRESRERGAQRAAQRIAWADGCTLPFMGQPLTVVLVPTTGLRRGAARLAPVGVGGFHRAGHPTAHLANDYAIAAADLGGPQRLLVDLPLTASAAQIRDEVQAWLRHQAQTVFTDRLNHFAPALGVKWRKLGVSSAGTRWGSASANGSIRLNWRLMHFGLPIIDYVVVHELSHLRVMDHSPRFWNTVGSVLPDYEARRGQLARESTPLW